MKLQLVSATVLPDVQECLLFPAPLVHQPFRPLVPRPPMALVGGFPWGALPAVGAVATRSGRDALSISRPRCTC